MRRPLVDPALAASPGEMPPSDGAEGAPARLAALVLAPMGRDAGLAARALDGAALDVVAVPTPAALCDGLRRPDLGVVLLTGEALGMPGLDALAGALADEPDWSEVPFVLFVNPGWEARDYLTLMDLLGRRQNVTVLERPVRVVAFRSVVEMAVLGRRQQFRVRDLLRRVSGFNAELQRRVDEQTAALRERTEQVVDLARSLAEAERRERARVAQLLHDDLQQVLYGLKIHVELLTAALGTPSEEAARVEGYVDEAIAQTRLLTTELHPPTLADDGIGAALGLIAVFARQRHGMTVHLDVIDGVGPLDPEVLALLTRSARELLFNVVKHAGTTEAWVRAWCDAEGCHLTVRDEGRGFVEGPSSTSTGLGLADLKHRIGLVGGNVSVTSEPGVGTVVDVVIPEVVA